MKAVCKINNLNDISDTETVLRLKRYIFIPDGELDLQLGKEYTVYGIEFRDNCPWYYICQEDSDEYPKPFAADFFDITDNRLSSYWKLSFKNQDNGKHKSCFVFQEWASDISFYENLIDGEEQAVFSFAKYKKLIDTE
jgi:hypothetical protein